MTDTRGREIPCKAHANAV